MRKALLVLLVACGSSGSAQIKIHEVVYDGVGSDADEAFTELTGPPGLSMDGWRLEGINGGSGVVYRIVTLDGVAIPADGVLVIATSSAVGDLLAERDFVASVDWQNGPDAIRLLDPTDQIADALQYGDAGLFNAGEGTPAETTLAGESLSRDEQGSDTDNNAIDFSTGPPTPGRAAIPLPPGATLSLPDTVGRPGHELDLPLLISGNDSGLLAMEVAILFDARVLTPVTVTSAISGGDWQIAAHVTEGVDWQDTLRLALATDVDTLIGDATLLQLRFRVADIRQPAQAALELHSVVLDDGSTQPSVIDGVLLRVGEDAIVDCDSLSFSLPSPLTLRVQDADEDRTDARDTLRIHLTEGDSIEVLHLIEDETHSGRFIGSIQTRHATPLVGDGLWQMQPRQLVRACYTDSLTSEGSTAVVCVQIMPRGHDAVVEATRVIEPGDTLWFRVEDRDLDRHELLREEAHLSIRSSSDTVDVLLAALDEATPIFDGALPSSLSHAAGSLQAVAGDSLIITHVDTAAADGDWVERSDTVHVVGRFGDADGNGHVQAYDANVILQHVLTPRLGSIDSLAANVDSLAPASSITPLDAALVLQQRVGILKRFPVQNRAAANHPGPSISTPASRLRPLTSRPVSLRHQDGDLLLWMEDRGGIIAAELIVQGIEADALAAPTGFIVAHRRVADRWHIALAGATPVQGAGALLTWDDGQLATTASVERLRLNDVVISLEPTQNTSGTEPRTWHLGVNRPNPFNGQTLISLYLPQPQQVKVMICNVLGQPLRQLADERLTAGEHLFRWDGTDTSGTPLASGVYTVWIRSDGEQQHRRIMLLR